MMRVTERSRGDMLQRVIKPTAIEPALIKPCQNVNIAKKHSQVNFTEKMMGQLYANVAIRKKCQRVCTAVKKSLPGLPQLVIFFVNRAPRRRAAMSAIYPLKK